MRGGRIGKKGIANPFSIGGLVEDDGFVVVDEDAVFEVPADGLGEDGFFEVAAFAGEVGNGVAVADAGDVLMDDGAFVEIGGGVVGGRPDQFDAALVGLVVGAAAGKGGEEGVMDVDDGSFEGGEKAVGKDLHVAGENDEFGFGFAEDGKLTGFGLDAGFPADGNVVKGDTVGLGGGFKIGVVGDDRDHFAGQFTRAGAQEDVVKAVIESGDKAGNPQTEIGSVNGDVHPEGLAGKGRKSGGFVGGIG